MSMVGFEMSSESLSVTSSSSITLPVPQDLTIDDLGNEFLPEQDLMPHAPPTEEGSREIAPWLSVAPPEEDPEPPSPPPKPQRLGFPTKASFSSFTAHRLHAYSGSTVSVATQRPYETQSVRSGTSTYAESAHTLESRRSISSLNPFAIMKRRSRSRLRSDAQHSTDPVPPLPSPDRASFKLVDPTKRWRKKAPKTPSPPPVPPIPPGDIQLDTNLDEMDGIVAVSSLPQSVDDSSIAETSYRSSTESRTSPSHIFSNPFIASTSGSAIAQRRIAAGAIMFDSRKVSPKTVVPLNGKDSPIPFDEKALWEAPESWAVEKGGEESLMAEYSSSDESVHGPQGAGSRVSALVSLNGSVNHNGNTSISQKRKSKQRKEKGFSRSQPQPYKLRVYRASGAWHVVTIDLTVTVEQLTPVLNEKLLLDPAREVHRLYLKERGRERVLGQTERPAHILKRRLIQAGYDVADGLDVLGSEDIQFLMKFVYKSNVLGPAEDELNVDSYDLLDLTGRSLRTIPPALYPHGDAIVSLNLSRNPMLEIPLDFIQACPTLRELRLSHMAMKKVPQSVRHCRSLHRLDLSCNRIVDLDDAGLDWIPELRSLKVQNNRIEKLPWYFPRLRMLKDLNISNNKFRTFPSVITVVTSLVDLDISFNSISALSEEIGSLQALERFIIVGNKVSEFPSGCSNLSSLRVLDCRRNNITDLTAMCRLPKIEQLLGDHNAVHALELSFGYQMKSLDASYNDITKLVIVPGPLGHAFSLISLDISNAKLSSLAEDALVHLTALQRFRIDHNLIQTIPDSLGMLTMLNHFSCSNNQLLALPSSIGKLQRLEHLEAHNNSLSELPETLWNCASLQYINVASNHISVWTIPLDHQLPILGSFTNDSVLDMDVRPNGSYSDRKTSSSSSFSAHTLPPLAFSLEKLYLGENRLTDDVLHPFTILHELQVLNLSFNEIQEIPPSFFRNLRHLRELYLSGNKLTAIPTEDLHHLENLEVVLLNGNRLKSLPVELGHISNLAVLDVGSNLLKYNINNYEFDWNWNMNENLRYLSLSGNKRLEIKVEKPDQGDQARSFVNGFFPQTRDTSRTPADFSNLSQLRILGLMDVTLTFAPNIPDENEDRRVRTSVSEVNGMAYGIADTLGMTEHLNMFDLVKPEFRGRKNEAIFAMFGRASHVASNNRLTKYLYDNFLPFFTTELEALNGEKGEDVPDALRRTFLKLNRHLHDYLYSTSTSGRKMSHVSASTGISGMASIQDISSVRSGASGIVLYFVGKKLYVANAGDALAVVSRQGTAEHLSKKHDPFDRQETARIRAAEGWVSPKGTVNDEIDISRSFGFYYLLPVVNPRPDIRYWELSELDEFVIVANPGLWDYVSYQTAVDIARSERNDPMIAAQKLRDFAIGYGAEGTTMIMVISVADLFKQGATRPRQPTSDTLIDSDYVAKRRNDKMTNRGISRLNDEILPPTGHLAIVFTDIRNSTHLWEVNPGMPAAIRMHNLLLRRQLRLCGGYEVKTEGDAFMCSFQSTHAALWWCLSVQTSLLNEPWPLEILECEDGQEIYDKDKRLIARGLSVRMGIHCGSPVCEPDPVTGRMDYFGPMVNRAARIDQHAAGGQIMCSANVIQEISAYIPTPGMPLEQQQLPQAPPHIQPAIEAIRGLGLVVIPVGEVKLKGVEVPEFVSVVYPESLAGRQNLEAPEGIPDVSGSRVQFSVPQMRELAMLCVRLEALVSSRVFRPLPQRRGSTAATKPETQQRAESQVYMYGNPNILIPVMDKASDADLSFLLDTLATRIENALMALTVKRCAGGLGGNGLGAHDGGLGLDLRTLQHLASFLGPSSSSG